MALAVVTPGGPLEEEEAEAVWASIMGAFAVVGVAVLLWA